MRKIVVFNLVSLDGYFAGSEGEIDWHNVDDEFNKFAIEHTKTFGTILFGRVTYQMMESFWPARIATQNVAGGPKAAKDPKMSKEDLKIAKIINNVEKIVFSKTLKKTYETPVWKNIRLYNEIVPEEIRKRKQKPGQDIEIFGSGTIVQQFTNLGLIDEYQLMVNPVILGEGKPMFKDIKERLKLKLLKTRTFKNGNVLLYYVPKH